MHFPVVNSSPDGGGGRGNGFFGLVESGAGVKVVSNSSSSESKKSLFEIDRLRRLPIPANGWLIERVWPRRCGGEARGLAPALFVGEDGRMGMSCGRTRDALRLWTAADDEE